LKRILLKLSGEALAGEAEFGFDPDIASRICREIAGILPTCEVAVVLGGGNLFRGEALQRAGMDRITGDHIGMLATIMNGLAFVDRLQYAGLPTALFAATAIAGIATGYDRKEAIRSLSDGAVTVLAGGTGNPLFTTDTNASLRGIEIGADCVLKATKVDGVYSADPVFNPNAERYDELTFDQVIEQNLKVMDTAAIALCRDHEMPIVVFNMAEEGALTRLVNGEKVGTKIG
jgi:uridylate kinase